MTGVLVLPLVLLGLLLAIALLTRAVVLLVPWRRAQEQRFRAAAAALGGSFQRSLLVADPELRLSLHGQPVFVTSSFGRYGHEISRVRVDGLETCPVVGWYLRLEPGVPVEHPGLGEDARAAAGELAALVGQPCTLEIRQRLWGSLGFAELLCGGFLTDRDHGPEALARAIALMVRVGNDLVC